MFSSSSTVLDCFYIMSLSLVGLFEIIFHTVVVHLFYDGLMGEKNVGSSKGNSWSPPFGFPKVPLPPRAAVPACPTFHVEFTFDNHHPPQSSSSTIILFQALYLFIFVLHGNRTPPTQCLLSYQ